MRLLTWGRRLFGSLGVTNLFVNPCHKFALMSSNYTFGSNGTLYKRRRTSTMSTSSGINPIRAPMRKSYKSGKRRGYSNRLASLVQDIVYRNQETKMVSANSYENLVSSIAATPYVFNFPVPSVSVSYNGRIGNVIQPVGISAKCLFYNPNSIPVFVRFIVLEVLGGGTYTNPTIQADLYEDGTPGNTADVTTTGFMTDLTQKVNRNDFKVLRDTVVQLDGNATMYGFAQEKFYRSLKGTTMSFPDAAYTQPTSSRYVVVIVPKQVNGDESGGSLVDFSYTLDMYYKD